MANEEEKKMPPAPEEPQPPMGSALHEAETAPHPVLPDPEPAVPASAQPARPGVRGDSPRTDSLDDAP